MDAAPDRAPDPLAAWLAATQGGADALPGPPDPAASPPHRGEGARAPRRLLLAAALPWLVVLALGAVAVNRSAPASSAPPVQPVPSLSAAPAAGQASSAVDRQLAAAAVLTLRLAMPDDQYLDTAVAEQIDTVEGAAVVTVAAAVLDRAQGQWSGPRHVRFAIPFSVGQSEPVALAAPWVLPATDRARAEPQATLVDDPSLAEAAVRTLRAAGYRDLAAPQLRRHTALPDILAVHVTARAPGEGAARDHEIWLDAAASRLLGGPATTAPAPLPAPVPAEAP